VGETRANISRFATNASKWITGLDVTDPMSGFFMVCTSQVRKRVNGLSGVGFRILFGHLSTPGQTLAGRGIG